MPLFHSSHHDTKTNSSSVKLSPIATLLKDLEGPLTTQSKEYQVMQTQMSHLSDKAVSHSVSIHTNLSPSMPLDQYTSTNWLKTARYLSGFDLNTVQIDSILVSIKHIPADGRGHEFHHYQGGINNHLQVVNVQGGCLRDSTDNVVVGIACVQIIHHLGVWGSMVSRVNRDDILKRMKLLAEYECKVRLHNILLNATVYEEREGKRDKQSAFMIPTSKCSIKILS